jgi:hypothetical protein
MALGGSAVKPPASPRLRERPGAAEACPILADHIPGVAPPAHYADLDF